MMHFGNGDKPNWLVLSAFSRMKLLPTDSTTAFDATDVSKLEPLSKYLRLMLLEVILNNVAGCL